MNVRYYIDPDTGSPHIYGHGVTETEVEEVLCHPLEMRRGKKNSVVLIGRTWRGRYLRVIANFDSDRQGCFVITAYDLRGKALKTFRRRNRNRDQS